MINAGDKTLLNLQETLIESVGQIKGTRKAIMFSGGFDSMLMACLAQHCGAKIVAVTVQFEDFNPLTVQSSIQSARTLGIEHHILPVKTVEFLSAFEALCPMTDKPLLDLDLAVVYAALKKYDTQIAGDTFISGMGSDQWLGDQALDREDPRFTQAWDWAMADTQAHHQVAQKHGCRFVFPFLSDSMLKLSQSIPVALKKDKKLLRALDIAQQIPHLNTPREVQVPLLVRPLLVKAFGHRASPAPIVSDSDPIDDSKLKAIIHGLWLEGAKRRE